MKKQHYFRDHSIVDTASPATSIARLVPAASFLPFAIYWSGAAKTVLLSWWSVASVEPLAAWFSSPSLVILGFVAIAGLSGSMAFSACKQVFAHFLAEWRFQRLAAAGPY